MQSFDTAAQPYGKGKPVVPEAATFYMVALALVFVVIYMQLRNRNEQR